MVIIGFFANSEGGPGSLFATLVLAAQFEPQNPMGIQPFHSIVPVPDPPQAPYDGFLAPNADPGAHPLWLIAQPHTPQNNYYVIQNPYYNNGANDGSALVFPNPMDALVQCATLNVGLQAWVRATVPGHANWVFPNNGEGWFIESVCHGVAIPRFANNGLGANTFPGIVGKAIHAAIAANMEEMTRCDAKQLNGVLRIPKDIPIAIHQVRSEYERRSVLYDPGD